MCMCIYVSIFELHVYIRVRFRQRRPFAVSAHNTANTKNRAAIPANAAGSATCALFAKLPEALRADNA